MAGIGVRVAEAGLVPASARTLPRPALQLGQAGRWFAEGIRHEAEQRRLFPWLAVAFGAGILVCLTQTNGPPALWAPFAAACVAALVLPLLPARPVAHALTLGLALGLLGFGAAALRLVSVAAPVLERTTIGPMTGWIETLDDREGGLRLVVRLRSFGTLPNVALPRRVRVSHRAAQPLRPGDFITANARLLPPPGAARPGGYDFARDAYFRGIGAVGSLSGRVEVKPSPEKLPWRLRLAAGIDEARNALTQRIVSANGGQAGAVAAALVTGKRGQIDAATNDVLRSAGIYHVVSISGLHMVLAAGVVFWLVRAILALVPNLALTWPIKKIAASCAMVGVTSYCAFSGWDVAAARALIMTLVMLGAILADRRALSMRNLAIAAILALAREPEALLGPSFQMSFGAVAGLIACAPLLERITPRPEAGGALSRLTSAAWRAVIATLLTTLVAQAATAPFATFHFQTMQPFGLLGNALTLPLVSLAVMPSAVIGMIAYPFALDRPVWFLMGQAVRGMLAISDWIASFAQANLVLASYSATALLLLAVALLVATLCISGLRWLALAPALVGGAMALTPARHDILVDREGSGAVVRAGDGRLAVLGRPPSFVLEQWLKADGDPRRPAQVLGDGSGRCDRLGCTIRAIDGRAIALVIDKRAFAEDCARADIVISRRDAPPGCDALVVIDRRFLAANGATAIRLQPGWPQIETVRRPDALAPWQALAAPQPSATSAPQPPVAGAVPEPAATPEPEEASAETPQ